MVHHNHQTIYALESLTAGEGKYVFQRQNGDYLVNPILRFVETGQLNKLENSECQSELLF